MTDNGINRKKNGRNYGRRRDISKKTVELPICPKCNKPVRDLHSAITHQESEKPAHFDCILKILKENTEIYPHEKICYLGNGSFGVLQFRNSNNSLRFFIRKRIQYEPPNSIPDWRKKINQNLALH